MKGVVSEGVLTDDIIDLTVKIANDKDKLDVVEKLLKDKNITAENFIKAVEQASNELSVRSLTKSPVQNKAAEICKHLDDWNPELATAKKGLAEGPRGTGPAGPVGVGPAGPGGGGPAGPGGGGPRRPPDRRPSEGGGAGEPPKTRNKPAPGEEGETVGPDLRENPRKPDTPAPKRFEMPEEGKSWKAPNGKEYPIGKRIDDGRARYTQVFELDDGTNSVIKIYSAPEGENVADVFKDVLDGSNLLNGENKIPQATIDFRRSKFTGEVPFLVQERVVPAKQFIAHSLIRA